jgi:hypothetical protein
MPKICEKFQTFSEYEKHYKLREGEKLGGRR